MLGLKNLDDIPFERDYEIGNLGIIGINTSASCNLRCAYCPENSGLKLEGETTLEERKSILDQAKLLGARIMLVAGTGEPLIDPDFLPTVEYAYNLGFGTLLYSNGLEGNSPSEVKPLSQEAANFIFWHNVTPIIKLESLIEFHHDFLTNVPGSHKAAMESLTRLQKAGYGEIDENAITRIGLAALYTQINKSDLDQLKRWCEFRGIKFNVDLPRIYGNLSKNKHLVPDFFEAVESTQESAVRFKGCAVRKYGLVIDHLGNARFCAETATGEIGNIREKSLVELLEIKNRKYPAICEFTIAGCCFLKLESYFPVPEQESIIA